MNTATINSNINNINNQRALARAIRKPCPTDARLARASRNTDQSNARWRALFVNLARPACA
jgi:hypothetical protein